MYNFNDLTVQNRMIASTVFQYGHGYSFLENPWAWCWFKLGLMSPDHFGAFITSTITQTERPYTDKKKAWQVIIIYPHKVLNKCGWNNCGIHQLIKIELPRLKKKRMKKCIISLGAEKNINEIIRMIKQLNSFDIAGIEISVSCHNVNIHFMNDINTLSELFAKAKKISLHPLIVKLSYDSNYVQIAKTAQDQGINLIHAINTIKAYHERLGNCAQSSYKNKKIALKVIGDLRKNNITIPIIGGSGIWTRKDIKDYKNAGADLFSMSHQFIYLPFWPAALAKFA